MSRVVRRRSLTSAAAVVLALVVPAAAQAATYTIKPGDGACASGDLACGGFAEAAAVAAPGDVFLVSRGTYPGANFTVGDLAIKGEPGVLVAGTLQFSGGGPIVRMSGVSVGQAASTGPGLLVTGTSGIVFTDGVIASAHDHGMFVSGGAANQLRRAIVITGGAQTSALKIDSTTGTPAKGITIDSSIFIGGAAGIDAKTSNSTLQAAAGDITIEARHVTAAGSTYGIRLDSNTAQAPLLAPGVGNIVANVRDSIAFNNTTKAYPGVAGSGANIAAINYERTIITGDRGRLFADAAGGNFRLRPDSPAIGQGGVTAGESATDIDGQDRSAAPTDLGGDEFVNVPPTAKVNVETKTPRAGRAVDFNAYGSVDRENSYGGGIVQYRWTFSDGATQTTTGPTASHTFAKDGDASVSLVVVDRQGAASAPAGSTFKVADGTPPTVLIGAPKNKQKISRYITKTTTKTVKGKKRKVKRRTRRKIVFAGLSKDDNGISQIILTLEKLTVRGKSVKRSERTSARSAASAPRCYWFNPKKGVTRRRCSNPAVLYAKLKKGDKNGEWSYTVRRNLAKGEYRLSAYGVDATGLLGNAGGGKLGVVRFTLR